MSVQTWPPGLMTPLVTPLRDGQLDLIALAAVIERQIGAGVGGLLVGGGSGEFGTLAIDERRRLATEVSARLEGRVPFVVQTGALATRDSLELMSHAEDVGAAGTMAASPFGEPINWSERRRFYERLDGEASKPIMIYNTPPSGLLSLAEIQDLALLPNISAIKDSSDSIIHVGDLLDWSTGDGFKVYVGYDSLVPYAAAAGAHGTIVGVGNLIPAEINRVFELCRAGEFGSEFGTLWRPLRRFLRFMEDSSNYVALCKTGLMLDGLDVGPVREPYMPPEDDEIEVYIDRLSEVRRVFS